MLPGQSSDVGRDQAIEYLTRYVQHPDLDSFSCASTLRPLKQVWQLTEGGPGGESERWAMSA